MTEQVSLQKTMQWMPMPRHEGRNVTLEMVLAWAPFVTPPLVPSYHGTVILMVGGSDRFLRSVSLRAILGSD